MGITTDAIIVIKNKGSNDYNNEETRKYLEEE